jgi:Gnt-I system high-affinity gluconate transporter
MSILIVFFCIAILVLLITHFKINAFIAFLLVSVLAGLMLGLDPSKLTSSIQTGIGKMLGSIVVVIVCGAMLGKLVAESGAAERIASTLMQLFGKRYIQWALVLTGFIIGIPLFYTVGFVLVMPLIFTVVYRYNLPPVFIGLPMLAALSVTHGFLPPHPSPATLVTMFNADMGKTLMYGVLVGIPTVIIAGPLFARSLKNVKETGHRNIELKPVAREHLPGLFNSIVSSLLPVIILTLYTLLTFFAPDKDSHFNVAIKVISEPAIVMLVSLVIATFTLGLHMKFSMGKVMDIYSDAVKDIAMLLLIISGAGALNQILADTKVSEEIAFWLNSFNIHPLVLGWIIASVIRVCIGSATVAGLTAAGIMMPWMETGTIDPSLMVLSIGAGSLMFSHVNDAGFWLYKEYFNLSIKDTIRSWSIMETIVAVCGLAGVMLINAFNH